MVRNAWEICVSSERPPWPGLRARPADHSRRLPPLDDIKKWRGLLLGTVIAAVILGMDFWRSFFDIINGNIITGSLAFVWCEVCVAMVASQWPPEKMQLRPSTQQAPPRLYFFLPPSRYIKATLFLPYVLCLHCGAERVGLFVKLGCRCRKLISCNWGRTEARFRYLFYRISFFWTTHRRHDCFANQKSPTIRWKSRPWHRDGLAKQPTPNPSSTGCISSISWIRLVILYTVIGPHIERANKH